ncbi:MAG: Clp protease N-terminal domain-containing protein [Chloroflexi bacterium]|nr:Clp protease N-terminal domain-containing protein [Chloroflexota bacterium]
MNDPSDDEETDVSPYDDELSERLHIACLHALSRGKDEIEPEHLLLAFVTPTVSPYDDSPDEIDCVLVLRELGVDGGAIHGAAAGLMGRRGPNSLWTQHENYEAEMTKIGEWVIPTMVAAIDEGSPADEIVIELTARVSALDQPGRYSPRLADLLTVAGADARERGSASAGPAHVLLAMLSEAGNPLAPLLESHGISLERLRAYHQSSDIPANDSPLRGRGTIDAQ